MAVFLFFALFFASTLEAMEARHTRCNDAALAVIGMAATTARARTHWRIVRDKKDACAALAVPAGRIRPCAGCAAAQGQTADALTVWQELGASQDGVSVIGSQELDALAAKRRTSLASLGSSSADGTDGDKHSTHASDARGLSENTHPYSFHGVAKPLHEDGSEVIADEMPLVLVGRQLSLSDPGRYSTKG
jgi:hypothetical protein